MSDAIEQASRLILLGFAAILLVNFAHGGPGQVKNWLSAKFFNTAS